MPAIEKAGRQGKILQCKNNLKKFHIADEFYAEDHNKYYVSIKASPWNYTWFRNKDFLASLGTKENDIRNDSSLTCPNYTSPSYARFSYAPNWANDKFWWSGFLNQSILRNRVNLTSQKIKFIENTDWHGNSYHGNPTRWYSNGEVGGNAVAYRHDDNANIMFFDGHAELRAPDYVYFNGDYTLINQLWQLKGDSFSD